MAQSNIKAIKQYCKCPSVQNFFGMNKDTQEITREISEWCLQKGRGAQGLALFTTRIPPMLYGDGRTAREKDPFHVRGKKLCGDDLELYFGNVFGSSNNYVYGMYKTSDPATNEQHCVDILAKLYPTKYWQKFEDLKKEYEKAKYAWELGVGPEVLTVRTCKYGGDEYAILVMRRWGLGSLTTLVKSGYYQSHQDEINKKLTKLLETLYNNGVTHGDLHSNNFLFDRNMNLKAIDFEDSRKITKEDSLDELYSIEIVDGGKPSHIKLKSAEQKNCAIM